MLRINLKNRAISQTTEAFNSMCNHGGVALGATSSGIYKIGGRSDNGAAIPAMIKSGMNDFGAGNTKRFRFFYFGLYTTGPLTLKVYCDGQLAATYDVYPSASGDMSIRVPISRTHQGRYWSWSIESKNGSFFALYSVTALPVILHPGHS